MRPDLLRTVTRRIEAVAADTAPDADLVRRFASDGDAAAFASLVRRHGPMVWGVCRHLLPDSADADDAFQATFLALVRGAGRIRTPAAVGAWLHGVAVRVATRAKRAAARRKRRERAVAAAEAAPAPVPDARWEAVLAAVHAEVDRLPDALRTAFVLCELGGVPPADAAARLGWKPGTLSGRLTRARQALMARLIRRGLCPAAAGVGVACTPAAVPARLVEAVSSYPSPAGPVPAAVATLASGVTNMSRTKLLAAAVLVAGGLAAGAWVRLVPQAGAQDSPQNPPAATRHAEDAVLAAWLMAGQAAPAWEFKYYAPAQPLSLASIEQAAAKYVTDGWEYAGAVKLSNVTDERKKIVFADSSLAFASGPFMVDVLVFKRRAKGKDVAAVTADSLLGMLAKDPNLNRPSVNVTELLTQAAKDRASKPNESPAVARLVQIRNLEAQIAAMQQKLDSLRKSSTATAIFAASEFGPKADLGKIMTVLVHLADVRFGEEGRKQRLSFSLGKDGLRIEGDSDAVDWVAEMANKLRPGPGK